MNNFDLLFSMFSPFVFQEAKNNIQNLEYYFQTNPNTMANPLVDELVKAVKTYDYDAVGEPLFQSIFAKLIKTPAESQKILGEINKWLAYDKEKIAPAVKYLQDVCASVIIQKAGKLFDKSPSDYIKYLKNYNLNTSDTSVFSSTKFSEIDINSIIAESSLGAVSTNVEWINRAFAPHNGIERGQIGIICAPPGVGKSLFSMNLAVWMAGHGEKVIYYCLGDMNMKDFIVRMGAIAFGISFVEAYQNIGAVYQNLKNIVGDNLEISINPAGTVKAEEITEMTINGNYTVAFIDYDGNLAGASEGESMYNNFGAIYNEFTKISLAGKLAFICAQPKIYAWNQQIELESVGESSKKQQVVDFLITISNVNPDNPNHLYIMKLPKARRGNVGAKAYVIRINGRFKEIPKGVYEQLRQETEEKNYTEQIIDDMIHQFNVQMSRIQKTIIPSSSPSATKMKNPFTTP